MHGHPGQRNRHQKRLDQSTMAGCPNWYTDGSSFVTEGWVEAYPTKKETANIVAKKILEEIFPRFGIPKVIGSDNGPAFVAQALEMVQKEIWEQLEDCYDVTQPQVPHQFQVRDSVLVH
ncbi:uncharacterized protein LOC143442387 [Arvicanthis niloticus]|uniref:uncharacterized protein LOC143312622 n=1 Tax=Arvicanthis niloticus TaxID=61156 RepID=UPI00402B676E